MIRGREGRLRGEKETGWGSGTSVGANKKQKGVRLWVSLAWRHPRVFLAAGSVDVGLERTRLEMMVWRHLQL